MNPVADAYGLEVPQLFVMAAPKSKPKTGEYLLRDRISREALRFLWNDGKWWQEFNS
jgi:hypothetical protein